MFSAGIGGLVKLILSFSPIGLFVAAFAPVLSYLRGLNFIEIGRNLIQGLINGVTGMLGALKSTITGAAGKVATWFKEKLGIHSPSRVFAGLGGYVMAGLDQGLANNISAPLSRITDLSARMTRALAVGAGGTATAAASPLAAQRPGSSGATPAAASVSYTININVAGGGQAQDIADQVREAIERIERERRGRTFGDDGG